MSLSPTALRSAPLLSKQKNGETDMVEMFLNACTYCDGGYDSVVAFKSMDAHMLSLEVIDPSYECST
jgi:hypothetical protein